MPRWLWWAPLVVLTAIAGLFVFRLGWVRANLTETDVIMHYAALYVAARGGEAKMTDCVAVPGGAEGVWLTVRCGTDAAAVSYPVDRYGRLVAPQAANATEPQT